MKVLHLKARGLSKGYYKDFWIIAVISLQLFGDLLCMFSGTGFVNSLRSLHIHVPEAVLTGGSAELICNYDLEGAQLYSIRWYSGMVEFYRYVPKESPPTRVFAVSDIRVDVATSDQNRVVLIDLSQELTGEYQCEVSADAPLFHTDIKAATMTVVDTVDRISTTTISATRLINISSRNATVDPPSSSPFITVNKLMYAGGDHVHANCSGGPSMPAPNITWFVNEQRVPSFSASQHIPLPDGTATSSSTLELETSSTSPVPSLAIRCEASLFDVWAESSETLRLREKSTSASALGRSIAGKSGDTSIPTLIALTVLVITKLHLTTPVR